MLYGFRWKSSYNSSQNSNLKWIFAYASNSAIANLNPWTSAFDSRSFSAGTGLHGFFGYKGHPSDIPNDALAAANQFLNDEIISTSRSNPLTVQSAWIHSAQAGHHGSDYGFFVLQSAQDDALSATPGGWVVPVTNNSQWSGSNPIIYYDASGSTQFTPAPNPINNATPGPYVAYALTPENWSDSYLASQADAREPGSTKYYQSNNQYRIVSNSYQSNHYEASGAVIASTNFSRVPYNYTQNDAYSFAVSQINQYGGLPSDAVLHMIITHYRHDISGAVLTGYGFIWRHANGMSGGDSIEAIVDNQSRDVCTKHAGGCTHDCIEWQTVYDQRVNYLYRLWRSISSSKTQRSSISSSQALSIASSQPKLKGTIAQLGTPLGYLFSYWSPPFYSLDNTAYPVYQIIYSTGASMSVDAASGDVLGITAGP